MNHFSAIQKELTSRGLDAMLLTDEANRYYASGFHSTGTDGIALVTREKNYYFTDFRYIEAAQQTVTDAEIVMTNSQRGYVALINEAIERHGIKALGYEDAYMTVAAKTVYEKKLQAELRPASELLSKLRAVKDGDEIALLVAAQRIAEKA
ncbi:MAG: aminopeptidase P family N-terminal domain-containing protein, partial [Oscillospiraceae bacterium]|nr:aminopeptidase P family N-terminal domain-containing protein [Oscillospiraceae bacterium]